MPLVSELLQDMDIALWYCCLDMASGFWVVEMTERARMISAFITPSGLFEWRRMPFGLKNAPQIYQRLIDNALYGYVRIGTDHDPTIAGSPKLIDVFTEGEPDTDRSPSILGRRSYIDDILIHATSWRSLYEKVEKLMEACNKWNLSISLMKSFWGRHKVDYLGHQISLEGLEAHPKDLGSLVNVPFPRTLRSMQSFLGSLNYYSRFIEDFAIYASILYELREADFHEMYRSEAVPILDEKVDDDPNQGNKTGGDQDRGERNRWEKATIAFTLLKAKIADTPILKHFDPDRTPVVVVYASKWAVSAALLQEHEGVYWPVTFTSRTLKPNEINYGIVEKEVLALLRVLDMCYTMLVSREIRVLTRYSTLAWLIQSSGLNGRLGRWAALLSSWTLEVRKCEKGEDEVLGVLAASITPREEVDDVLIAITPVEPLFFKPVGWFKKLFDLYREFEDRDRQVLWEAAHVLPISREQRDRDPALEIFARERKQRRSRSGPRWKGILKFILQGMIEGHCDLDIFLDPFFMHFPRSNEQRMWYPGLGNKRPNLPNLATALYQTDAAEPWRNQYRAAIAQHPGSSHPRLTGKFIVK